MKALTREWLRKAEGDFEILESLSRSRRPRLHDGVCFHAQQCAEKYLKARLYEAHVPFPPIHNLLALLDLTLAARVRCRRFRQAARAALGLDRRGKGRKGLPDD
jgi:HEPN domain-containing protein